MRSEIICWGTFLNFLGFLVCTFSTRYMPVRDAASGLVSSSMELYLYVVSLHLISWTSLSASFAFYSIDCEQA